MKRYIVLGVLFSIAAAAWAVEIPMRDGTVVTAESYRITGSYVIVTLESGAQVAYDVADVDLEALRAAGAASRPTAESAGGEASGDAPGGSPVGGRTLRDTSTLDERESQSPTITDRDVRHVRGRGLAAGEGGEGGGAPGGLPEDVQVGGGVTLKNLRVSPVGEGAYSIEGEVVNGLPEPVINVRVQLEVTTGGDPWQGEVPVSSMMQPGEVGVFQHSFNSEGGAGPPSARASVLWMQEQSRREPDYTKAGGVPHPSNLPLEHGGVAGADMVVQPTPTPTSGE
jgi:hypothetical protein